MQIHVLFLQINEQANQNRHDVFLWLFCKYHERELMPTATATQPKSSSTGMTRTLAQSKYASSQSRFATSKLIKNLGSGNHGVEFSFSSGLRTAHGRD